MSARSSLNFPTPFTLGVINFNSSGDNIIVPGTAGKRIRVYRLKMLVGGASNISIKDGSAVLDGPLPFAANQGMILDFTSIDNPPWYDVSPGNSLVINSTNAVQIGGNLDYIVSP